MENNERRSPISTYVNGKNEATTADENVAFAKVGVKLGSLARLKRELCESLGKSLENSTEMSISIKNSKHGLSLTVQNYDDGSGKISDDSSYIETSPNCSSSERSALVVKRNYMSVDDVFSLPELKDQSIQCDIQPVNTSGQFVSAMLFHPYRLKPNRQIKCIQCKTYFSP